MAGVHGSDGVDNAFKPELLVGYKMSLAAEFPQAVYDCHKIIRSTYYIETSNESPANARCSQIPYCPSFFSASVIVTFISPPSC